MAVTSLEETLPALNELAPKVGPRVHELAEQAAVARRSCRELIADLEKSREEAGRLLAEARQAVDDLNEEVAGRERALSARAETVGTRLTACATTLDRQEEERGRDLDGFGGATDELESALTAAVTTTESEGARVTEADAELRRVAETASAALDQAEDLLEEKGAALQQALDRTTEAARTATLETRRRLRDLLDGTGVVRDAVAEAIGSRAAEHERALAEARGSLGDGLDAWWAETDGAATALADGVEGVVEALREALRGWDEDTAVAPERLEGPAEELVERADALSSRMDPLPDGLQSARGAAERLGLSWN